MDVEQVMQPNLEELDRRLTNLEKQKDQEILTLVEILSNATFFGHLKKVNCRYAKDGQCGFFSINGEAKNKIPIVTDCRIRNCQVPSKHFHIELSNITCTFCNTAEKEFVDSHENGADEEGDVLRSETSDEEASGHSNYSPSHHGSTCGF